MSRYWNLVKKGKISTSPSPIIKNRSSSHIKGYLKYKIQSELLETGLCPPYYFQIPQFSNGPCLYYSQSQWETKGKCAEYFGTNIQSEKLLPDKENPAHLHTVSCQESGKT